VQFEFERAIARLPLWILLLAVLGTAVAFLWFGLSAAGGYLLGSLGAWVNLRIIERAANRIAPSTGTDKPPKSGPGAGVKVFIQFSGLVLAALVILKLSGFSVGAAFCGFLICPAAVILEIVYELVTFRH
jgi:hypothetical protein